MNSQIHEVDRSFSRGIALWRKNGAVLQSCNLERDTLRVGLSPDGIVTGAMRSSTVTATVGSIGARHRASCEFRKSILLKSIPSNFVVQFCFRMKIHLPQESCYDKSKLWKGKWSYNFLISGYSSHELNNNSHLIFHRHAVAHPIRFALHALPKSQRLLKESAQRRRITLCHEPFDGSKFRISRSSGLLLESHSNFAEIKYALGLIRLAGFADHRLSTARLHSSTERSDIACRKTTLRTVTFPVWFMVDKSDAIIANYERQWF